MREGLNFFTAWEESLLSSLLTIITSTVCWTQHFVSKNKFFFLSWPFSVRIFRHFPVVPVFFFPLSIQSLGWSTFVTR